MNTKQVLRALQVVAVLAFAVTIFLLYEHYSETGSEFCKFGMSFDCGIVNKSPYSTIDGIFYLLSFDAGLNTPVPDLPIPVALFGSVLAVFLFVSAYQLHKRESLFGLKPRKLLTVLRWVFVAGIIFSAYLVFVQAFILLIWCIFCLALDTLFALSTILLFVIRGDEL